MRVYSYLWKFSRFRWHCCRRTLCLTFWVLWDLARCSQNTVGKAQQPIVKLHSLHVHLSRIVYLHTHVEEMGSYTRLNYPDWQHLYQMMMAPTPNAKREHCRRLYDQQITMGQVIFCVHSGVYIALWKCQPSIQIVRHILSKWVF